MCIRDRGGIFLIIPFLIFLLIITINLGSLKLFLLLLTIFGFFIIGFLDDYLSIRNKENTGLTTKEKFILQSVISIIFILLAYTNNLRDPKFIVIIRRKIKKGIINKTPPIVGVSLFL